MHLRNGEGRASFEVATRNDLLGGWITSEFNPTPNDLQVSRITRRFVLSLPLASVVAGLAYGEGR